MLRFLCELIAIFMRRYCLQAVCAHLYTLSLSLPHSHGTKSEEKKNGKLFAMKYNTIARPTTSSKLDLIIHICTQRLGQYIVADMRVSHSLRVAVI